MKEILIRMTEKQYEELNEMPLLTLHSIIRNGQILPKGHGRLIDADELLKYIDSMQSWLNENGYRVIRRIILTDYIRGSIPTIIEADKEGAEE